MAARLIDGKAARRGCAKIAAEVRPCGVHGLASVAVQWRQSGQ
jgi:hypothetical protein